MGATLVRHQHVQQPAQGRAPHRRVGAAPPRHAPEQAGGGSAPGRPFPATGPEMGARQGAPAARACSAPIVNRGTTSDRAAIITAIARASVASAGSSVRSAPTQPRRCSEVAAAAEAATAGPTGAAATADAGDSGCCISEAASTSVCEASVPSASNSMTSSAALATACSSPSSGGSAAPAAATAAAALPAAAAPPDCMAVSRARPAGVSPTNMPARMASTGGLSTC